MEKKVVGFIVHPFETGDGKYSASWAPDNTRTHKSFNTLKEARGYLSRHNIERATYDGPAGAREINTKPKYVKKKEKKPTGFGLLNTSIPGAGIGSGFGFSGESKIARLKKKEKELKQQAATWKAEAEIKKLREQYGKPTLIDMAKNALLKRKEKKSIYD